MQNDNNAPRRAPKPQPRLAEMIKGQVFDGFLLVRSAVQRTSSNGGKYLDFQLCDVSAEVNGKMWDGTIAAPPAAQPLRVRGVMQEYNNKPQLRVDKIRPVTDNDVFDMNLLVPCAPQPAGDMMDAILNRVDAIENRELKALVLMRLEESEDKILYFPAAKQMHHAERAGLLHHTSTMLRAADAICEIYPQLDADLVAAGVILHDLCKMSEMNSDELGVVSDYTTEGMLIGHLVQGVAEIQRCARKLNIDPELALLVEHMILSHHDLPEFGSPKRPMFPEAEVLHTLDLLDARMFEMASALNGTQPGTFTDRIWSLDRKLYRRKGTPVASEGE